MCRRLAVLLCVCTSLLLGGCSPRYARQAEGKLLITATLFPQYDFAREIAGDLAEVRLLLPPGLESHSYEPAPSDMVAISRSDLFLFTGQYMEPWAQSIIEGISEQRVLVVDVSDGVELCEEEHAEHDHDEHSSHHHTFDPHIWTSPVNAAKIAKNIKNALCTADPAHAQQYSENYNRLAEELSALDQEFRAIVQSGERKKLVFGSRFALLYFVKEYGLYYDAAFDSCLEEAEPSVNALVRLIGEVRRDHIPVVYYEELTDPKVARAICGETGAEMLLFHSCHNVSRQELEAGVTYVELMRQNAANLRKGLN